MNQKKERRKAKRTRKVRIRKRARIKAEDIEYIINIII